MVFYTIKLNILKRKYRDWINFKVINKEVIMNALIDLGKCREYMIVTKKGSPQFEGNLSRLF